jgi:hypothetical protein
MKFTLNDAKNMRKEVEEALKSIAEKYDSKIQVGKITYGTSINMNIEFSKMSTDSTGAFFALTKEAQAFLNLSYKHEIPKEALNVEFEYKNDTYKITGYVTRNSKYPLTYVMNGKRYKTSPKNFMHKVKSGLPGLFL